MHCGVNVKCSICSYTWTLGPQMAEPFQKVVEFWGCRTLLEEVGRDKPELLQPRCTFSSVCFLTVDEMLSAILWFCHHGFSILDWTPGNRQPINFSSLKLLFIVYLVITVRKVTNKVMFRYLHVYLDMINSPRYPTVSAVKGRVM